MVGITSYAAYIPYYRLGNETLGWNAGIEKAIANYDEDSITMAAAAAINCVKDIDRKSIDGLFFATTTSPYLEKQGASIIAEAVDLGSDIIAADFTNSLRSGASAMRAAMDAVKAGSAKKIVITSADLRIPQPRSQFEQVFGDGAAAVIIGDTDVVAEIEGSYTITDEILDIWRVAGEEFVRSSEDRFAAEQGYLKVLPRVVNGLLEKYGFNENDFAKVVFYAPDARRHSEMVRILGFDPKTQVQDPLFGKVGNTGASFALLMLIAALENSEPGDRILFASYGDGADAFIFRVTEEIQRKDRRSVESLLNSKRILPDYLTYIKWRSLMDIPHPVRRPPLDAPSAPALYRERDQNIRLYGVKCNSCGYQQYPPQRICSKCQAKDDFTPVRLSDKKSTLFTYSHDYLGPTLDLPLTVCFLNIEGGGRIQSLMTDRNVEEIKIGMQLEMSLRKLHTVGGIHNYYWKCVPVKN